MRVPAALVLLGLVSVATARGPDPTAPGHAGGGASPPAPPFHVDQVADGVYAFLRNEPPGLAFDSNCIAIVGPDDVIVVDTQATPRSTREVLDAIRRITTKPVSYVINTHSHFDHMTGNSVYRDAFPGVRFIAHEAALADLESGAAERMAEMQAHLPATIRYFEELLQKGTWLDGSALTEEGRRTLTSDAALARAYESIPAGDVPVLPRVLVHDRLTLVQGTRRIELRFLGRGHTAGDLVVHLPDRRVVLTGDLVVWPVPLVGTTSFPIDFAATLDRLAELPADTYVPGHGPVLRDRAYLDRERRLLTALATQARAAVEQHETLEQARTRITLDDVRQEFVGASQVRASLFSTYVLQPGVARAFEQASGGP